MQVVYSSVVDCVKDRCVFHSMQTREHVTRTCLETLCEDVQRHVAHVPSCSPAFSDVTQVYEVEQQPRPKVSSRHPSE